MSRGAMGREAVDRRDSKKLQIFRPHASGVSQALWPADTRRSLSTGRVAQQRRYLVLRGKWWATLATILEPIVQVMQAATALFMGVLTLLVGGSILAALLFHTWIVLLFPAIILSFLSLAITPSLLLKLKHMPYVGMSYGFQHNSKRVPRTSNTPSFPTMRRSPETPMPTMPTAPLVRELETFDLSQTGVEHFLDSNAEHTTA